MKMQNFDFNAGQVPAMFSNPEFGSVRIIVKENGEPLFCLRDVATCLGYANPNEAINNRCEPSCVSDLLTQHETGSKHTKFGPESEVYRLIFGSKLDSAKKFQDWVFKEVLPSIRKTGSYSVSLFENPEFGSVRIIVKENGEPLFCLRDVCSCLSLDDTGKVAGRIDQDELTRLQVVSGGQTREMIFTTEPGLYDVILGARSNERTKPFRKWVTSEVLPSIRKTGSYSVTQKERMLPQSYAEALRELAATVEENERLSLENKKQAKEVTKLNIKIENDAPKIEMYNDLINSHDCISTTELAKIYKMSTMKFNAEMRAHGLYRALDNLPLQKSINAGIFIVKEVLYTDKAGKKRINSKVYVTPKGQELIHNMFKAWEEYSGLFGD